MNRQLHFVAGPWEQKMFHCSLCIFLPHCSDPKTIRVLYLCNLESIYSKRDPCHFHLHFEYYFSWNLFLDFPLCSLCFTYDNTTSPVSNHLELKSGIKVISECCWRYQRGNQMRSIDQQIIQWPNDKQVSTKHDTES